MKSVEVNFDGIIGPTHHYGGLSQGNLASQAQRLKTSYPRQAALEGLKKMKLLADLGIRQAVLPPHERPDFQFLKEHHFHGSIKDVIKQVAKSRLDLLSIASSASAMWAANAATVSPSADTIDKRVHLTPANLHSTMHRQLEPEFTTKLLRLIFADKKHFQVHDALSNNYLLADEGAANHMRLCPEHGKPGIEIFVYGRDKTSHLPEDFPARQSLAASKQIAIQHGIPEEQSLFWQQRTDVIDAGVFHNDVIAISNQKVLLCNEHAYVNQTEILRDLQEKNPSFNVIEITDEELTVQEAVQTYLFNSQLLTTTEGTMLLLCPTECETHSRARQVLDQLIEKVEIISEVKFIDVRQSMQNGGGPACLRLRVVLTENELASIHQPILLTEELYRHLVEWVNKHYREELTIESLRDPHLTTEVYDALEALTEILDLGNIYPFQQ